MLKRFFLTAAILITSPVLVSGQDIFWSFSSTELTTSLSGEVGSTGSAYICADLLFDIAGLDLNLSTNSPCLRFTGGEAINPEVFDGDLLSDFIVLGIDGEGTFGNLFASNISNRVVCSPNASICVPELLPGVAPNVGPNGALLLARVDFEIVGEGNNIELEFALGDLGAVSPSGTPLNPSFGSATLDIQFGSSAPSVLFGDINLDGLVDFSDIFPFIAVLSSDQFQLEADLNQDCRVNFLDISFFITVLAFHS